MKKSRNRNRRGHQQTQPACSFFADDTAQAEIDASRQTDGENGTDKLPRGKAEENRFPVRADFFWNFDFYKNRLRFVENLTEFLGYEIIFIGKNLTKRRKCYELYTNFIQGNRPSTLDRWSGTGEPANGNPYPLEAAASAARLLLCSYKAVLAALGGSTPNSLHPAFYRLHPVFCRDMDCPLRP